MVIKYNYDNIGMIDFDSAFNTALHKSIPYILQWGLDLSAFKSKCIRSIVLHFTLVELANTIEDDASTQMLSNVFIFNNTAALPHPELRCYVLANVVKFFNKVIIHRDISFNFFNDMLMLQHPDAVVLLDTAILEAEKRKFRPASLKKKIDKLKREGLKNLADRCSTDNHFRLITN